MSAHQFTDLFSPAASSYAASRPRYPSVIYEHVLRFAGRDYSAPIRQGTCLDCATGSGQAARDLSPFYSKVIAIDASKEQLAHAFAADNIEYRCAKAETTGVEDCSIDLVTVAAGVHWFNIPEFMAECERVLVAGGTAAFWTYSSSSFPGNEAASRIVADFWDNVIAEYKNPKLGIVERLYEDLDVAPLVSRERFTFEIPKRITLRWFVNYQQTTSPVISMRANGIDPIPKYANDLLAAFATDNLDLEVDCAVQYCLVCAKKKTSS